MAEFFGAILSVLIQMMNHVVDTIEQILGFISNGITYIGNVYEYSSAGMAAVRSMIECVPSPILAVVGGCIVIILLMSVFKLFI